MSARVALFAILCTVAFSSPPPNSVTPASEGTGIGVWLNIVAERPRDGGAGQPVPVLPVHLPLNIGGAYGISLPVLLVPVPVPSGTCAAPPAAPAAPQRVETHQDTDAMAPLPRLHAVRAKFTVKDDTSQQHIQSDPPNPPPPSLESFLVKTSPDTTTSTANTDRVPWVFSPSPFFPDGIVPDSVRTPPVKEAKTLNPFEQSPVIKKEPVITNEERVPWLFSPSPFDQSDKQPTSVAVENLAPLQRTPELPVAVNYLEENEDGTYFRGFSQDPARSSSTLAPLEMNPFGYNDTDNVGTSADRLLQSFLSQSPQSAELPAVLPPGWAPPGGAPAPLPAPAPAPAPAPGPPPRPRWPRSLALRGELTVPRAGYTEAYTVEWDKDTGAARVAIGAEDRLVLHRIMLPDGHVQHLEVRSEESEDGRRVRRCARSPPQPPAPHERAAPGLPDLEHFRFDGYSTEAGTAGAERWRRSVHARAGAGGGARGEALSVTHELLVVRGQREDMPLRYSVSIDSSVLGNGMDGYTHRFYPMEAGASAGAGAGAGAGAAPPDAAGACRDTRELPPATGAAERLARAARFSPLLEFTMPMRDPRHDLMFARYVKEFARNYTSGVEEAIRKNVLIQHARFVAAANRLGAGFELELNFLADRLDEELAVLRGVAPPPPGAAATEPAPDNGADLDANDTELPERFDWRDLGAVSPVRYQGQCASCWAFAVAGAVEGALWLRTRRLTPLSPQCLVDCAQPFGGNGCRGTWPDHAYEYVRQRGLPAEDQYTPYQEKVLRCRAPSEVGPATRIAGQAAVRAHSVGALRRALRRAPVVVLLDATAKSFVFYKSGVLRDQRCGSEPPSLNHAVLGVGWGAAGGAHFALKNSWSAAWGEAGFVRVAAAARGACGALARPSAPALAPAHIVRADLRAAAAAANQH